MLATDDFWVGANRDSPLQDVSSSFFLFQISYDPQLDENPS